MRVLTQCVILLLLASGTAGCTSQGGLDIGEPAGEGESSHELLGQKAPPFKAALLDETPFDLADHLGQHVVILDFWATWCGPCVQALPVMAEVAAEYKSKGVEFFAVNLQDEPDAVKEFLKEKGLDIRVVMDRDGGVGALYKAEAIPQTVIIGKDGTVERVHVGTSPNLKSTLTSDLDALLAGKKLAAHSPARRRPASAIESLAADEGAARVAGAR